MPTIVLAPRALSRDPAARHRQGPRRRPFRNRREDRAEARAAARALAGGDRDRRVAGALAPVDEQHRLQARHRRPADDRQLCRARAVAGAVEAAVGVDRRRHPRGRAEGVERLEGGAAARALPPRDRRDLRRAQRSKAHDLAHRSGAGRGAPAAARFQRRGIRGVRQPRLSVLLAVASMPRRMRAMPA